MWWPAELGTLRPFLSHLFPVLPRLNSIPFILGVEQRLMSRCPWKLKGSIRPCSCSSQLPGPTWVVTEPMLRALQSINGWGPRSTVEASPQPLTCAALHPSKGTRVGPLSLGCLHPCPKAGLALQPKA